MSSFQSLNKNLNKARENKNDEFYTQLVDIENEVQHYKPHFENKVVYCNCDDPKVSKFFQYFKNHFEELKLKRLITTCYKNQSQDLFSTNNDEKAVCLEYAGEKIEIKHLRGDGDFRSKECIDLLRQSDIVVTNPLFSLFRKYVAQLFRYDKKFLIIGSLNAFIYIEVFKLFKENKIWLGYGFKNGAAHFKTIKTKKYTKGVYNEKEVSKIKNIPRDYSGVMGVPITFLEKYNPKQFEILGLYRPSLKRKVLYRRIAIKNKRLSKLKRANLQVKEREVLSLKSYS